MNNKSTQSTTNLGVSSNHPNTENDIIVEDVRETLRNTLVYDLNDQRIYQSDKEYQLFLQKQIQSIPKFDGHGDCEHWLKIVLEKFDLFQLVNDERNVLVPDILTGEALVWYVKQQEHMTTFYSFIKNFLRNYGHDKIVQNKPTPCISTSTQSKSLEKSDDKDDVINLFRTQFLFNRLQELPKFAGKSKQNVSKWLREINQAIHLFTLTDDEKLSFIFLCLEGDARDWYFDNNHLFSTWSLFIQELINTFEFSGKAAISSSVFIPIQNQQQLEKSSVILENHDKLYDTKKTSIPKTSTSHVIIDKSAPVISIKTVIESTSTVIESVTHNPDPNDFEQHSEMNELTVAIQQEKLHSEETSATSFIQTQKLKPSINHDGTLDGIRSEKFPIILGKVNLEVKQTLRLAKTSIQTVLYKLICEAQNQMIIQINTILKEILLIINIYNNILKIYRFMAPVFDPGGEGGNVWSGYTYFIFIMGGLQYMSDYVGLNF